MLTDQQAIELIKNLQTYMAKTQREFDLAAPQVRIMLLQLRAYSDTPGRVIPKELTDAFDKEFRMVAIDAICAVLASMVGGLDLTHKS